MQYCCKLKIWYSQRYYEIHKYNVEPRIHILIYASYACRKVFGAFEGKAGVFTGGIKDIVYPQIKFADLYNKFKVTITFGVALLGIALLAPVHPVGVIGQFFVYLMGIVFVYGPFAFNAEHTKTEKYIEDSPGGIYS